MRLLLLAALLLGGPPEGFRDSVRLSPIATAVAGKPTTVRCSRSFEAWGAKLQAWGVPSVADGVTDFDGTIYLRIDLCQSLEGWLRGKNIPSLDRLGYVTLTFTHEMMHARGTMDEGEAECAALKELPTVLREHFAVRRAATLRKVLATANINHRLKPPQYRTVC